MNTFVLHPRLAADTVALGRLELSVLLLMNDATYPWFILVPERLGVSEIYQLAETDRPILIEEVALLSRALTDELRPDKLNVAALGNVVPQLHLHVIARFRSDPAWPAPVWGKTEARSYSEGEWRNVQTRMAQRLGTALRIGD
jgi:diadenosine tetraphosphate (Ap4A) HIT family hydrolase